MEPQDPHGHSLGTGVVRNLDTFYEQQSTKALLSHFPNVPLLGTLNRLGDEHARLTAVCHFPLAAIPPYSRVSLLLNMVLGAPPGDEAI